MDVLLEDPSRPHPFYVDKWDIFLPSDMWLGVVCAICFQNMSHQIVSSQPPQVFLDIQVRLGAIQAEVPWTRWCPLATKLSSMHTLNVWLIYVSFVYLFFGKLLLMPTFANSESKALEEFWKSAKHTDWFQHHPILSAADPCSGIVGIAVVCDLSNLCEGFIISKDFAIMFEYCLSLM